MIDEGYIKFELDWIKGPPILDEEIEDLIETRHILLTKDLIGHDDELNVGFGNLSKRAYGTEQFFIYRDLCTALERTPGVVVLRRSHLVETAPVGGPPGQGPFLNGAALIETTLDARGLLDVLQRIEGKFGRDRSIPS